MEMQLAKRVNGAIMVFIGAIVATVGCQTLTHNPALGISMTLTGAYIVTALFWNDAVKQIWEHFEHSHRTYDYLNV
jgi:hypothetical protein